MVGAELVPGSEAGWPQRAWWQVYGDAQLDQLVSRAVAGNPSMAVAAARVRQARSLAVATHAGELPSAQLDVAVGRKVWSDNVYYGAAFRDKLTWNNTATLGLSYNVDLWDRNKNATLRAEDEMHAVAADARAAQLDLEGNVVRTYVQLALQYGLLDNTEAMLKGAQDLLLAQGVVQKGDLIVVTWGEPIGQVGGTNALKILRVGEY